MADEHARYQVFEAAKQALTGLTTTGSNVIEEPTKVTEFATLPALSVEAGEESIAERTDTGETEWIEVRDFEILVTGICATLAERKLIAAEIEVAMSQATNVGKLRPVVGTQHDKRNDESGEQFYVVQTTFAVRYVISNVDPTRLL